MSMDDDIKKMLEQTDPSKQFYNSFCGGVDGPKVSYLNTDCLEQLRFMRMQLAGKADLVVLDPPYEDWGRWLQTPEFWQYIYEACTPQANIICFSKQPFSMDLWRAMPDVRWRLVWAFSNGGAWISKKLPLVSFQDITIYTRNPAQAIFNERTGGEYAETTKGMKRRTKSWQGYSAEGRQYTPSEHGTWMRDVIFVNKPAGCPIGAKPIELLELLLKVYSNKGSFVLDPFAGRGTTLMAARNLGRSALGFEKDQDVFACGRIQMSKSIQ